MGRSGHGVEKEDAVTSNVRTLLLHPSEIIHTVCDLTDKETIYVTDVGQHQMWAAQYLKHDKHRRILSPAVVSGHHGIWLWRSHRSSDQAARISGSSILRGTAHST